MDYSQFQVKYIKNPDLLISNPFELSFDSIEYEPIDISGLKFDSALANEPTAIIRQEAEVPKGLKTRIKRIMSRSLNIPIYEGLDMFYEHPGLDDYYEDNTEEYTYKKSKAKRSGKSYKSIPASKGLDDFNRFYDLAISQYGDISKLLKDRRNLFTKIALVESSFNSSILNMAGAPAYGYFLFMEGPYRGTNYSNITKYAGVDVDTFRRSPALLMKAANSLANSFLSSFKPAELKRLHELGWSDNAIIGGCWLGGPGGVRKLIFRNIDSKDVSGTSVSSRMKMFNNI